MTADEIIKHLNLKPLPEEGGYYHETYRANTKIPSSVLKDYEGERNCSTAIYYLITPEEFSGFHALKSDEVFHFYVGDAVKMVMIDRSGNLGEIMLGNDFTKNQICQHVVPANTWQGTKVFPGGKWALLGTTVAPGFEFADSDVKPRNDLINLFPQHENIITEYTHR